MATRAVVAVVMALLVSGCARLFTPRSQCGETPRRAIELFLDGVSSFNIGLIVKVIAGGLHPFEVFGGGNRARGREIVRQLIRHYAEERGNLVDSTYHFVVEIATDVPDEKRVVIERRVKVTHMEDEMRETFELYRRTFRVRFAPLSHCITEVKMTDPEWIRIDVDSSIADAPGA